jgi:hypothetical protein
MSEITEKSIIRVEKDDERPLVVTTGTESAHDVYSVMANELRRNALAVIANEPTGMDVSRLVEEVADRIEAAKTEAASDEVVQEVRQSLHHIHMPKMVSAGLVEYDDESRTVKATSEIRTLEGASEVRI